MSMYDYEKTLLGYLENIKAQILARPLNLGGVTASGGGAGGPPGGFTGYLPQTRVAYDLTEAEDNTIPLISGSLLDNLNHIRYRVKQLEDTTGPGSITIKNNGTLVASGITIVDFYNANVAIVSSTEVSVTTSGVTSGSSHSHKYNVTVSGTTHFDLPETAASGTLRVYYNGLRQEGSYFVVDGDYQGFTTTFTTVVGDEVFVDYDLSATSSGTSPVAGGGHVIQDEGTPLTQRTNLNFVGAGVTVTDDAGNDATIVTINGGGGSGVAATEVYGPFLTPDNLTGGVPTTLFHPSPGADSAGYAVPFTSALSIDDDMDGADPFTWTITPSPTYSFNDLVPSHLYIVSSGLTCYGSMAFTPHDPGSYQNCDVRMKFSFGELNSQIGLYVSDDTLTQGAMAAIARQSSSSFNLQGYTRDTGAWVQRGSTATTYLMAGYLQVANENGIWHFRFSQDGIIWQQISSYSPPLTPTKVGIYIKTLTGYNGGYYCIDWIKAR